MFSLTKFNDQKNDSNFNYKIFYKHKTESTNDDAILKIEENEYEENMVFIADQQTKGRGRQNRSWYTKPDCHLAFSLILTPKINSKNAGLISLMAGVSVLEGLKKITNLNFKLKWPNDIIYNKNKIAGILIETKQINDELVYIVGIGININENIDDFPLDLRNKVPSLNILKQKQYEKESILYNILKSISINYNEIHSIHSKWISLCGHIDQKISFHFNKKKIIGQFMGITKNGHAVINIKNENHIFPNGELFL